MDRRELIRMLVLNEISDDYEEPTHIFEQLANVGRSFGVPIDESDITRALGELVRSGWAKAYRFTGADAQELLGFPSPDDRDSYYLITNKGREAHSAFGGWPFDDDGDPVPGWSPPRD